MLEAVKIALEVYSLGFVVAMVVALIIKLTHMAINASTKS